MLLRLRITFLSQDLVDGGTGCTHPPSDLCRDLRGHYLKLNSGKAD